MQYDTRHRALMGIAPDSDWADRDLERIVRLVDIIRRYELLTEHLLDCSDVEVTTYNMRAKMETARRRVFFAALEQTRGHKGKAAKLLGISYKMMNFYGHKYGTVSKNLRKGRPQKTREKARAVSPEFEEVQT